MSLGIEAVKPFIKIGADLRNITSGALADGKITIPEALGYLTPLLAVQGLIETAPAALEQIKQADSADRAELSRYAIEELKIAYDQVEQIIAKLLEAAVLIYQVVAVVAELRTVATDPK